MGRIADLIEQQQPRVPPCTVTDALGGYTDDERAEWQEALGDGTLKHVQIVRAFAADGVEVSASAVSRHRRGECRCGARS